MGRIFSYSENLCSAILVVSGIFVLVTLSVLDIDPPHQYKHQSREIIYENLVKCGDPDDDECLGSVMTGLYKAVARDFGDEPFDVHNKGKMVMMIEPFCKQCTRNTMKCITIHWNNLDCYFNVMVNRSRDPFM